MVLIILSSGGEILERAVNSSGVCRNPNTRIWCEYANVDLLPMEEQAEQILSVLDLILNLQVLMLSVVGIVWGLFVYFAYYKYVGYCHRHSVSTLFSIRDNQNRDNGDICSICRCTSTEDGYRHLRATLCCRQIFCNDCLTYNIVQHNHLNLENTRCPVCRGPCSGMYGIDDPWYTHWIMQWFDEHVIPNPVLGAPAGVPDVLPDLVDIEDIVGPGGVVNVVNNPVVAEAINDDPPPDDDDSDSDDDSDDGVDLFAPNIGVLREGPVNRVAETVQDLEIVDNNSHRVLHVMTKNYRFPDLQFFGLWNDSNTSPLGTFYNDHFGWFFHTGKYITVELPSTLVDELGVYWAGRQRTVADLLACIAICKVWLRGVTGITAHQLNNAAQYAAAIAMHKTDNLRQNVMRVAFSDFCSHMFIILFLTLNMLVLSWLPWRFFRDLTRYFVVPQPLPQATNFLDFANIFGRMNIKIINYVAEYTKFTAPVVDCEYWRLPRLWVYECLDTYESYYQISIICWLVMVVVFLCVVIYLSHKKPWVVGYVLLEDVVRFALAYFLSQQYYVLLGILPSIILGLVEFICVMKIRHLLFHVVVGLGFWCPLPFVVAHVVWNYHYPCDSFSVIRCIRYALSNIVIPTVRYRAYGVMKEPPTTEPFHPKRSRDYRPQSQCLYGIGSSGYRPVAYAANYINEKSAVEARILAETPEPNVNSTRRCIKWVKRNVLKLFPKLFRVESVDFQTYINKSNASASVKRILKRTMEKLREEGIDENSILSRDELYNWTRRKAFVKVENNVYRTPAGRKLKASRLIQGASPEFICLVGPWMMSFQAVIKKQWNWKNFICFTSGVSNLMAAKLVNQPGWTILEDDIGAFDASVNRPWLELELWIFQQFGAPRAVLDLIRENIDTHGVTNNGIRYKRQGMRKSGDPYTSVGNSLMNGLMHIHIYCQSTGKTVDEARSSLRMLVQGDDNLMVYVPGPNIDWVHRMLEFGFNSEAVYRETLYEAEFCSNLFYETDIGPVLAPKPGKVMAKLGYYVNPPANVDPAALVRGTALGLYSACHHIPPLRAYLDRLLELTDGIVPHKTPIDEWKLRYILANEVPETWCTLDMRYGWTGACQAEFEQGLKTAYLGQEYDFVLFHLLCDRDTLGPQTMYIGA